MTGGQEVFIIGGPKNEQSLMIRADEQHVRMVRPSAPVKWTHDPGERYPTMNIEADTYRVQRFKLGNREIRLLVHPAISDQTADAYLGDLLYEAWQDRKKGQ